MNETILGAADRAALEHHLLTQPFDHEARERYARLLLSLHCWDDVMAQAQLLTQQLPGRATGPLLAARALLGQEERESALRRYHDARGLEGFEVIEALESLAPQPSAPVPGRLQLVGSPSTAAVRPLQSVSAEKVRFSSIVGMEALKKTIRVKIIEPYLKPGLFSRFKMQSGGGILLYGPPGCGKTMIARAIANECQAEFIPVGISDVLNMWIGESERNLAAMFDKARAQTPAVLFFDELDALAFSRAKASSSSTRTVVNEFLAQLDGFGRDNKGVLMLAATNMPWDVDEAMKRPGRFARQIFVAPPDLPARREMLRLKLMDVPIGDVDLDTIAANTLNYSGADIDGLIELAKESALTDSLAAGEERPITAADFEAALAQTRPSTVDWLRTVRNVVKYAGDDGTYREVEQYLKQVRML